MWYRFLLFPLGLFCSCTTSSLKASKSTFSFNATTGKCLNAEGLEGLNPFDPKLIFAGIDPKGRKQVISQRNVNCTDFRSVAFHKFLGVNYNLLDSWDFRGCRFEGASFQFNFIQRGLFLGSDVELLDIGYGRVAAADSTFNKGDMPIPKGLASE